MSESSSYLQRLFGTKTPYCWHSELHQALLQGATPETLGLPTAAGKTFGALRCWFASLLEKPASTPRRLVYVVNRRAVADQVYEDAIALAELAASTSEITEAVAKNLKGVPSENPLAVYAFRGQRPIDQAWQCKPTQPAILVGTPDMLGSRLLFRAYVGSGNWRRAQAAGLLGQDAWWILDEPHLAEPFWGLLCGVRDVQSLSKTFRPFWITAMGATNRATSSTDPDPNLREDARLRPRLETHKPVSILRNSCDAKTFVKNTLKLVQNRLGEDAASSIGIIVSTVRLAKELHAQLSKNPLHGNPQIHAITGAMRGFERDAVLASPDFRAAFLSGSRPRSSPAILVGTQCLEAGFDGDFDMLVSDIPSIPSVIQRLGRLNRLGEAHCARGYFMALELKEGYAGRVAKSSHAWMSAAAPDSREWIEASGSWLDSADLPSLLKKWSETDSHARALVSEAPPAQFEFDQSSAMLFASSSFLPGSSQTRTDLFLKGIEPLDQGEVSFVWREEAAFLENGEEILAALRLRPPVPLEMAQLSASPAREFLAALARRLSSRPDIWRRCHLVFPSLETSQPLFHFERGKFQPAQKISGGIVVLPPEAGGYDLSFLQDGCETPVADIRGQCGDSTSAPVVRVWNGSGFSDPAQRQAIQPPSEDVEFEDRIPEDLCFGEISRVFFERTGWAVFHRRISHFGSRARPVTLLEHTEEVRLLAKEIAETFDLDSSIVAVIESAALHHDHGKTHHGFQRFLGNENPDVPLAKSGRRSGGRSPFRHEALSVLMAESASSISKLLVGTHHGHGRPVFQKDHLPPRVDAKPLAEVDGEWTRNFAALNHEYSPWGVAWLESIVKSADATASAASEGKEEL